MAVGAVGGLQSGVTNCHGGDGDFRVTGFDGEAHLTAGGNGGGVGFIAVHRYFCVLGTQELYIAAFAQGDAPQVLTRMG